MDIQTASYIGSADALRRLVAHVALTATAILAATMMIAAFAAH